MPPSSKKLSRMPMDWTSRIFSQISVSWTSRASWGVTKASSGPGRVYSVPAALGGPPSRWGSMVGHPTAQSWRVAYRPAISPSGSCAVDWLRRPAVDSARHRPPVVRRHAHSLAPTPLSFAEQGIGPAPPRFPPVQRGTHKSSRDGRGGRELRDCRRADSELGRRFYRGARPAPC